MSGTSKGENISVSLDSTQFKSLSESIQNLVKVLAAAQIKRDDDTEKNARFLTVFGLNQYEIADVLGVDQSTVNKALSKAKKKANKASKGSNGTLTKT